MIILRVLFVVILAVKGLVCVQPFMSIVSFYYTYNDVLDIEIILKNVPREASIYVLYYQTDNCYNENTVGLSFPDTRCIEPTQPKKIPTNRIITFTQILNIGSVRVYLELRNGNRSCSTKSPVMYGVEHSAAANSVENKFRSRCLNSFKEPCQIFVDFKNKCEVSGKPPARMNCTQAQRYLSCAVLTDNELPDDTLHQWYQHLGEHSLFNIPSANGKKTKYYRIKLYKFDSNTVISSHMSSTSLNKDIDSELYKITSPINENYYVEKTYKFHSSKRLNFTCYNSTHGLTQIGLIDPTGYTITTYNTTSVSWRVTRQNHNSIICCIDYAVYLVNGKVRVERLVYHFTKLIYDDDEPVNAAAKGLTESPVPVNKTNVDSSVPFRPEIIVTAVVLGVVVILGISVLIYYKYCKAKSNTEVTPQTYTHVEPFYLNLLFKEECQRELDEIEQHYEVVN